MSKQWKHELKNFVTTDELKKEIEQEFMFRAKSGRVQYSMEEIIYIVSKVIDDTVWEKQHT